MKIGFLGTGKIASAIVEALCASNLRPAEIFLSPRNEENSTALAGKYKNVRRASTNQEVLDEAEIIFVCLKADVYKDILRDLTFRDDHKVISLIPFSTLSTLKELVHPATAISRATPLPTVVHHVCPIQVFNSNSDVLEVFNHIGQVVEVATEQEFHTIWTLTGLISPYYDLMAALSNWAAHNGADKSLATKYVADMFHALALAAAKSEEIDFQAMSSHAATSGGLNEWAAKSICSAGAHDAFTQAADHILKKFDT